MPRPMKNRIKDLPRYAVVLTTKNGRRTLFRYAQSLGEVRTILLSSARRFVNADVFRADWSRRRRLGEQTGKWVDDLPREARRPRSRRSNIPVVKSDLWRSRPRRRLSIADM